MASIPNDFLNSSIFKNAKSLGLMPCLLHASNDLGELIAPFTLGDLNSSGGSNGMSSMETI